MYTEKQLQELVKDVTETFAAHLDSLAKSEDEFPKKEESKEEGKEEPKEAPKDEKPESKEEDKKDEKPADEQKPEAEEPSSKPKEDEHGEKQPEGEQKPPMESSDEDHGYDDEDMQHMHSMYSTMSKPELKAHHDCIRKCMDSMGLAKCEDGMAKSEKDGAITLPADNQEVELHKSELSVEKAKGEESKKNLEAVIESLAKFVSKSAPAGKAITSVGILAKGETFEEVKPIKESEVTSILTKKASNPNMSAEDRQAINDYYFGSKNIEKVRHLLK